MVRRQEFSDKPYKQQRKRQWIQPPPDIFNCSNRGLTLRRKMYWIIVESESPFSKIPTVPSISTGRRASHLCCARAGPRVECWVCVCVCVREKWAKAPPHSKSERGKKGKANWYTPLNSGRRKRIGVFMNRISKQQDNQAHREPRLLPPVKTDTRHRFPAPEIVPLRSGLSFYVI